MKTVFRETNCRGRQASGVGSACGGVNSKSWGSRSRPYYRWKKQYKGLESEQVRALKQLQEENTRLKRVVADLTFDKVMLKDVLAKNF